MGEVQGSVFSLAGAAVLSVLAVLTWWRPQRSLLLFIMVAPVASVPAVIGWDYRLYWALMLAIKTFLDQGWSWPVTKVVPARALLAWLVMMGCTALVIRSTAQRLTSDDVAIALSLLNYFVVTTFFVVVAAHLLLTREDLMRALRYAAAGTLAVSVYGIGQAFVWYSAGISDRITGTLMNANAFAGYLTLAAISLIAIARTFDATKRKRYIIVAVIAICCALLTLSRMGLMAILTGLALIQVTRTGRIEIRKGTVLFAGILLLATVFAVFYVRDMRNRLTFSDDPNLTDTAALEQQAEDLSRWEAAAYALQVVTEHPLVGIGFGTFTAINYETNGLYVTTHNTTLELLAGMGLLGAALFAYFLRCLWKQIGPRARILMLPVLGSFVVISMLGDYLQSLEAAVVLTLTYLFGVAITREQQECAA
jgi:O-antigen ligase